MAKVTSVVWASLDLDWVAGFIERAGLPTSTVMTVLDDKGIVQYRSVDLDKYAGKPAGAYAEALSGPGASARDVAGLDGVERCTSPRRWRFADSQRAVASRSASPGPPSRRHERGALAQPRSPRGWGRFSVS